MKEAPVLFLGGDRPKCHYKKRLTVDGHCTFFKKITCIIMPRPLLVHVVFTTCFSYSQLTSAATVNMKPRKIFEDLIER